MEKKYDVAAMGELLIDFAMNGQSEQGNNCFEACPGGAPCNVLAMLGKLGRKTAFLGKVGEDQFGKLLKETIEEVGVDSDHACICTYFPGWRSRFFFLQKAGSGYDAPGRRSRL